MRFDYRPKIFHPIIDFLQIDFIGMKRQLQGGFQIGGNPWDYRFQILPVVMYQYKVINISAAHATLAKETLLFALAPLPARKLF